jgi:N-dimethylarginine dimethylaminohydrolase
MNTAEGERQKAKGESPIPEYRTPNAEIENSIPVTSHQPSATSLLMCAPTGYGLFYEINPWMTMENQPDIALATRQWEELYRTLTEKVGANVHLVPQSPDCPDMVFTANAGLVRGQYVMLSNFRHPQRQVEEPHFRQWFEEQGYSVQLLPVGCKFEGEGDALFAGDTLLAGYLKRSDICAHRYLSESLAVPVLSLELIDDRWYHLDTCLFPLTTTTVVYYPGAFDPYARVVIESNFDTLEVNHEEALRFACNAVVIGQQVVLPSGCPRLTADLEARGYTVHSVDLSEFLKAGGAAKCLTLFLR